MPRSMLASSLELEVLAMRNLERMRNKTQQIKLIPKRKESQLMSVGSI